MNLNLFLERKLFSSLEKSFLIIDKIAGRTSHDEVFFLKKNIQNIFKIKVKVGHSGTLDPKVTGVLVCGINKGTRALEYILLSKKVYLAEFLFHKEIERKDFEKELKKFLGKIKQLPPVRSAVKREVREREVYNLKILEYRKNNRSALLLAEVERGTYIRKLAHDIGQSIGINISMGSLRRIRAGVFSVKDKMVKNDDFRKNLEKFKKTNFLFKKIYFYWKIKSFLFSLELLFNRLEEEGKIKKIFVNKKSVKYILSGNPVRIKNLLSFNVLKKVKKGDPISIFYKKKVLALGEVIKKVKKEESDYELEIIKVKKVL